MLLSMQDRKVILTLRKTPCLPPQILRPYNLQPYNLHLLILLPLFCLLNYAPLHFKPTFWASNFALQHFALLILHCYTLRCRFCAQVLSEPSLYSNDKYSWLIVLHLDILLKSNTYLRIKIT